jgi:hypothetical protein
MMPTASDLDDPLGFAHDEDASMTDEDFDAAIGQLLDSGDDETPPGEDSGSRAEDSTEE